MKILQTSLRQRGVTLIEMMVGLSIGLLVVAVAMGALDGLARHPGHRASDASGYNNRAPILRVISRNAPDPARCT